MLTKRQRSILGSIVERYVADATPVSSHALSSRGGLGVSSATIRSEVAVLEEGGYITRPHPSAGSVPSDKAYRLYVEAVAAQSDHAVEPAEIRSSVRERLSQAELDDSDWTSAAATTLSRMVGNLAVATSPKPAESRVMRLEVVPLEGLVAMMVIILEQARLRRHLLRLTRPVHFHELDRAANRVRELVEGQTRRQIAAVDQDLSPLERDFLESAVAVLEEEDRHLFRDHYLDGLRNLLAQPEFAENHRVREIIAGFEDGTLAQAVLEETPGGVALRVVIGAENRKDVLRPCSVVIGRYGAAGTAVGAIAAVGPTRMRYRHTIDRVRLMTSVMTDLVASGAGA